MRTPKGSNIAVAARSNFAAPCGLPRQTEIKRDDLRIVVLYTTPEATKAALGIAAELGYGLGLNLTLLDIQVVPFSCGMDRPPVDPDFARRRLEKLTGETDVPIVAEVVYTRDRDDALARRLSPGSMVLIPVRGFLGRLFNRSLVRKLTRRGHNAVMVPCK